MGERKVVQDIELLEGREREADAREERGGCVSRRLETVSETGDCPGDRDCADHRVDSEGDVLEGVVECGRAQQLWEHPQTVSCLRLLSPVSGLRETLPQDAGVEEERGEQRQAPLGRRDWKVRV